MSNSHIVIVDANAAGISALEVAQRRGFAVTFVRSERYRGYYPAEVADRLTATIDRVLSIKDSADLDELTAVLAQLHRAQRIDGMLCLLDVAVLAVAEAAARLGIPGTDPAAVRRCRFKPLTRAALQDAAIPSARFATVRSAAEAVEAAAYIGYPLIVKPANGTASKLAAVIHTAGALTDYVERYQQLVAAEPEELRSLLGGRLLLEERLSGRMVSAEVAADGRAMRVITIGERKRAPHNEVLELGTTIPARLGREQWQMVEQYARQVATALGLDRGIFHLEIMLTERGPRLIEANPRAVGGNGRALILSSYGLDIYELALSLHLGGALPAVLPPARRYTAVHLIAAASPAVLEREARFDWLDQYGAELVQFNFRPTLGDEVRQYRSNFDALGAIIVSGATSEQSNRRCEEILVRVEEETGLSLLR